ncbi:hydroxyisourate hydrolase [Planomonospora sp. ID91781]|uniref:Hydroxyisourate hydrolase n=3 Tax=Planomonospora TaxID=1998 RepID=A0A171DQB6_9ACTN|nr:MULTISPECIES: hydroxyisourate hydrolase [Planomonospora]MBG0824988.1 hydroxyisourate hydrolase [Planomonospora sp. ID91781]GAT71252.1 hydroxyisourate hydrolase [Planomonospora sphaerica]GGK97827.1 hypothetical protein GCM10010126_66520 [Planomonospora parontospora]GII12839.1 hypothetical protein Ppa06_66370 [Planomonospora parontospora subsp. parontospora]
MSITVQALDGVYGRSAAGVRARLEQVVDDVWTVVAGAETDSRGCVDDWSGMDFERGLFRIAFDSDHYFAGLGLSAVYPEISVMFRIADAAHSYRIQVTLSPSAYSTYFGSCA